MYKSIFKNNNYFVLHLLIIIIIFVFGFFLFSGIKSGQEIINTYTIEQLPHEPGQPIKWVKKIKVSDINKDQHVLVIPKDAKNVKISTSTQNTTYINSQKETDRNKLSELSASASQSTSSALLSKKINNKSGFFARIFETISKFFSSMIATASDATILSGISDSQENQIDLTASSSPIADFLTTPSEDQTLQQNETDTNLPDQTQDNSSSSENNISASISDDQTTTNNPADIISNSSSSDNISTSTSGDQSSSPSASTDSNLASSTAPSSDIISVEYETPAPVLSETDTDTGKIVSISAEDTSEVQITNVLAYTNIPEIYKVGQENKIKIKWTNNDDQNVTFKAYDLNGNGKLDYVEWTVPHLSTQTFEIIFISKAFELDQNQEIINDIYDTVATQDQIYATVPANNYVRTTFNSILDNSKDITLFAKPTDSNTPVSVKVFPVYVDEDGNQTQGPELITVNDGTNLDFSNIDHAGKYRILLSNLETPTDIFDLQVVGGSIDFDYIVDPAFTSTQSGNFNIGTTWGGACTSSCTAGVDFPGASDTAIVANGHTVTMDSSRTVAGLTVNTGGILATASAGITVAGDATVNGTVSGTTAMTLSGASNSIISATGGTISSPITLSASYTIDVSTSNLTISGAVGGAFAITKTGAGTLVLSGTNTYTGLTNVNAGTLNIQNNSALGTTANGT
ncbi:MAG: autotransporter-associated beta strand repeat-containing protein, partial [bacterium]